MTPLMLEDPFPDAGHEAIRLRVMAEVARTGDLSLALSALNQLAGTVISLSSSSLDDRQQLNTRATASETKNAEQDARLKALEARPVSTLNGTTGQGSKTLTVSLGASNTTLDVVFRTPMPDANYIALTTLDASSVALLGSVSVVLPITNKTKTGCTVTVRNTAAVTLASSVTVYVAALSLT